MILNTEINDTFTIGEAETKDFSINVNKLGNLFDILRNRMYKNPLSSVIREIASNAWDANVDNNITDPIEIEFKEKNEWVGLEDTLTIKDKGKGMSKNFVLELYSSYLYSSKDTENKLMGGFGIGSKSPFAISSNFRIKTTVKEEDKTYIYNYVAFIDPSGIGKVALNAITDGTGRETGTEIIIPLTEYLTKQSIKLDSYSFTTEVKEGLTYLLFPYTLNLSRVTEKPSSLIEGNGIDIILYSENRYHYRANFLGVLINKTILYDYKLDEEQLKLLRQIDTHREKKNQSTQCYGLAINFEIGELDIIPSREELANTPRNKEAISKRLKELKAKTRGVRGEANQLLTNLHLLSTDPEHNLLRRRNSIVLASPELLSQLLQIDTHLDLSELPKEQLTINKFIKASRMLENLKELKKDIGLKRKKERGYYGAEEFYDILTSYMWVNRRPDHKDIEVIAFPTKINAAHETLWYSEDSKKRITFIKGKYKNKTLYEVIQEAEVEKREVLFIAVFTNYEVLLEENVIYQTEEIYKEPKYKPAQESVKLIHMDNSRKWRNKEWSTEFIQNFTQSNIQYADSEINMKSIDENIIVNLHRLQNSYEMIVITNSGFKEYKKHTAKIPLHTYIETNKKDIVYWQIAYSLISKSIMSVLYNVIYEVLRIMDSKVLKDNQYKTTDITQWEEVKEILPIKLTKETEDLIQLNIRLRQENISKKAWDWSLNDLKINSRLEYTYMSQEAVNIIKDDQFSNGSYSKFNHINTSMLELYNTYITTLTPDQLSTINILKKIEKKYSNVTSILTAGVTANYPLSDELTKRYDSTLSTLLNILYIIDLVAKEEPLNLEVQENLTIE